ncbi:MAG: flagellar basal body P-ring protein FlgI [Planctomycetaceae bacterium]
MNLSKLLCSFVMILIVGCTPLNLQAIDFPSFGLGSDDADKAEKDKKKSDEEDDEEGEFDTKVMTPLISEYVQISGLNMITLHGVGLVTGLNGTGGDPPPSMYRTALLEDMKKHEVKNPNSILSSPNNALVVIKAYLPPLIKKGETFDIEVYSPEGSPVKSLNGGWLLPADLSEQALIPGRGMLEGHRYAKAEGPVLVSMGTGDEADQAGVLRRGRIVAGGKSIKEDRNLTLYLRNDFRSYRNSKRVADSIGKRFFEYDSAGQRKPLAVAKTDQQIELKVLSKYKDNFPRYLQVIRNIAFREEPVARRVRMRKLKGQLLDPETAEDASIKLEAIGEESIPILKSGLQSKSMEVRFHSAAALAYLGDQDGLEDLAKAVRDEAAFRVFGLAALASLDVSESHVHLRKLLNEPSSETRYGAFRALTTLDKNDPFVQGERLNKQFNLHVLDTEGPPMVHLTNRRKSEVVLFGADQKFKTPFSARAGLHILVNAPAGSETVTVARIEVGREERRTVSTRIADVVRAVTDMDASYPDVAMLLAQAGATQNLPGRIEIDALPQAGRSYVRPRGEFAGSSSSKARVGNSNLVPNLFSSYSDTTLKEKKVEEPDDAINQKSSDVTAEKPDAANSKEESGSRNRAASRDRKTDSDQSEGKEDLRADAKSNRSAKKSGKNDEQQPDAADDDDETEKTKPASAGRSWNPFRFFSGLGGQTEPDIEDSEASTSKKPDSLATADSSSDVPSQSEP